MLNREGPLVLEKIGEWTNSYGLMVYDPIIWRRRANLHGARVRATVIDLPVMSTNFSFDHQGKLIGGKGFLFDLWHVLEGDLNFTSSLSLTIDGKFGGKTRNGTWDGMVGMLLRDEADVILSSLTKTSIRYQVIDFTIPLFPKVHCTFISPRIYGTVTNLTLYVKRFSVLTWAMIFMMTLILAIAFYIVNDSGVNRFHSMSDSEAFGPLQSVGFTAMMLMQLSYNVSIRSTSAKILFMSCSIFAYIIFTFFACDLIAGMTTGPKEVPVKSFQDVLDRGYQAHMCKHHNTANFQGCNYIFY